MQRTIAALRNLVVTDEGQDLLEYGLLTVLIAIVAVGAVMALGQAIENTFWQTIANKF